MKTDQPTSSPLSFVRQHFLTLLLVAYVCSVFFPAAGNLIRTPIFSSSKISFINFMLSTILLTLGLSTPLVGLKQIAGNFRWVTLFYVVRIAVAVMVAVLTNYVSQSHAGVFIGFILLCAAPTAASSASWSLQLGSCKATTIALILGTTLLSLLLGPTLLFFAELLASIPCKESLSLLRQNFGVGFVLPWVVLPTLAGMAWRSLAPKSAERVRSFGLQLNPLLLLVLNYANAASSFPKLVDSFSIQEALVVVAGAVGLFAFLQCVSQVVSSRFSSSEEEQLSQTIGTSMSNTGLILVMATLALPGRLDIHLPIIVYTFVQHLGVARLGITSDRTN